MLGRTEGQLECPSFTRASFLQLDSRCALLVTTPSAQQQRGCSVFSCFGRKVESAGPRLIALLLVGYSQESLESYGKAIENYKRNCPELVEALGLAIGCANSRAVYRGIVSGCFYELGAGSSLLIQSCLFDDGNGKRQSAVTVRALPIPCGRPTGVAGRYADPEPPISNPASRAPARVLAPLEPFVRASAAGGPPLPPALAFDSAAVLVTVFEYGHPSRVLYQNSRSAAFFGSLVGQGRGKGEALLKQLLKKGNSAAAASHSVPLVQQLLETVAQGEEFEAIVHVPCSLAGLAARDHSIARASSIAGNCLATSDLDTTDRALLEALSAGPSTSMACIGGGGGAGRPSLANSSIVEGRTAPVVAVAPGGSLRSAADAAAGTSSTPQRQSPTPHSVPLMTSSSPRAVTVGVGVGAASDERSASRTLAKMMQGATAAATESRAARQRELRRACTTDLQQPASAASSHGSAAAVPLVPKSMPFVQPQHQTQMAAQLECLPDALAPATSMPYNILQLPRWRSAALPPDATDASMAAASLLSPGIGGGGGVGSPRRGGGGGVGSPRGGGGGGGSPFAVSGGHVVRGGGLRSSVVKRALLVGGGGSSSAGCVRSQSPPPTGGSRGVVADSHSFPLLTLRVNSTTENSNLVAFGSGCGSVHGSALSGYAGHAAQPRALAGGAMASGGGCSPAGRFARKCTTRDSILRDLDISPVGGLCSPNSIVIGEDPMCRTSIDAAGVSAAGGDGGGGGGGGSGGGGKTLGESASPRPLSSVMLAAAARVMDARRSVDRQSIGSCGERASAPLPLSVLNAGGTAGLGSTQLMEELLTLDEEGVMDVEDLDAAAMTVQDLASPTPPYFMLDQQQQQRRTPPSAASRGVVMSCSNIIHQHKSWPVPQQLRYRAPTDTQIMVAGFEEGMQQQQQPGCYSSSGGHAIAGTVAAAFRMAQPSPRTGARAANVSGGSSPAFWAGGASPLVSQSHRRSTDMGTRPGGSGGGGGPLHRRLTTRDRCMLLFGNSMRERGSGGDAAVAAAVAAVAAHPARKSCDYGNRRRLLSPAPSPPPPQRPLSPLSPVAPAPADRGSTARAGGAGGFHATSEPPHGGHSDPVAKLPGWRNVEGSALSVSGGITTSASANVDGALAAARTGANAGPGPLADAEAGTGAGAPAGEDRNVIGRHAVVACTAAGGLRWHKINAVMCSAAGSHMASGGWAIGATGDGSVCGGGAESSDGRRMVITLTQIDVTEQVEAQARLAKLLEQEHKVLEGIYPRHVIEYLTLEGRHSNEPLPATDCLACGGSTFSAVAAAGGGKGGANGGGAKCGDCGAAAPASSLLSSLPANVARMASLATWHTGVTVLFADIVGFTNMCHAATPLTVMAFLNQLYSRLDAMIDIYKVYKVETIGDCYMLCGGLVAYDDDGYKSVITGGEDPLHAVRVMEFAKAMLRASRDMRMPHTGEPVQMRIGLHSGPVTSGVVGDRMPRFCLFGDTVNTASRMESTCRPGSIHVSEATHARLPNEAWRDRGMREVKGKGEMRTFEWAGDVDAPFDGGQLQRVIGVYL